WGGSWVSAHSANVAVDACTGDLLRNWIFDSGTPLGTTGWPSRSSVNRVWTSGNRGSRIEAQIVDSAAIRALSPAGLQCRRRGRRFALWTSKAGGSGEAHASLTRSDLSTRVEAC